jgi:uridine kinase
MTDPQPDELDAQPREPRDSPNLWRPADDLPPDQPAPNLRPALVLGIVGDSGSGKNTVADAVAALLGSGRITDVRLDDYHRFTREERAERGVTSLNPMVHNLALMQEHLRLLRQRRPIRNRSYSHADGTFGPIRMIEAREIVLVRGLLGFPTRELQNLYDLSVFLQPEPELLFRWKLRRDVRSRGYAEAEVLKYIAAHLLDAKEFVLPQAQRAHLHVVYSIPEPEADDTEVRVTLILRREAAGIARESAVFAGLPLQCEERDGDLVVEVPAGLSEESVDSWARARLGVRYDSGVTGVYTDESGEIRRRPTLALVEALIATIAIDRAAAAAA